MRALFEGEDSFVIVTLSFSRQINQRIKLILCLFYKS